MKRKNLMIFTILSALIFCGCSKHSSQGEQTASQIAESAPIIQEVESLSDADILIPAVLVGDEISQPSEEEPSETEISTASNTKTISLTGEERTTIVNEISAEISANIQKILDDKDYYPNIISITPNSNCSEFTIALKDGVMNTYESMLVMSFYMIGNKYQIYSGIPTNEAKTVVKYINATSGELISESDSTNLDY